MRYLGNLMEARRGPAATALTKTGQEYNHIGKWLGKTFCQEIIICGTNWSQIVDQEEFYLLTQQKSEDNWPILKILEQPNFDNFVANMVYKCTNFRDTRDHIHTIQIIEPPSLLFLFLILFLTDKCKMRAEKWNLTSSGQMRLIDVAFIRCALWYIEGLSTYPVSTYIFWLMYPKDRQGHMCTIWECKCFWLHQPGVKTTNSSVDYELFIKIINLWNILSELVSLTLVDCGLQRKRLYTVSVCM